MVPLAYIFDPEVLHECAKAGLGMSFEDSLDRVTEELDRRYPGWIDTGPRKWVLNNAGGAMGQMTFLHCSITEYIIFFGTPIGTEGHSGRYRTEVWDFMLKGEMWTYIEGERERTVSKPGDAAYLGADQAKGYRIPDHGWMLEYSRGPIPSMVPFGVADTMMSTLDVTTLSRTLVGYGGRVVKSLLKGKV